ncbi:MAG TPA: CBM35 domain-containing protein [Bryobacteraceae bacterium]|nr:CBM35 domain-containing protein [Bryobacteraceae bacterium]
MPYLGWSSFSQQTLSHNFLTQKNITAQSDALLASGLESHGFTYINMDSGWMGAFDNYGRPIPNPTTFPSISTLIEHIHANGQKAGIYWIPGVEQPAVDANYPILGTPYHIQDILVVPHVPGNAFSVGQNPPYHNKIDFSKPGAQEYVNSVVNLFASWGIDFIKLDGVTPGSDVDNPTIDNRADVEAWSKAIAQSGRPIWLTISWALDEDYLSTWQQFANARRIEDDIECEGGCSTLTDWPRVALRFYDLVGWENAAGSTVGWNDLDSLDVGAGSIGGLSEPEQQSAVTLWAMANAPMYLGADLTTLDDFGKQLFSNDDVIEVDRSGHPAKQILGGFTPIWATALRDGKYYLALFNMNAFASPVTVPWHILGFATALRIQDLWNRVDLGRSDQSFSTVVPGHGTRLLRITAEGHVSPPPSQSYEAEAATLSGTAAVSACPDCSGGAKVGYLGLGANNNVTFNNIHAPRAGIYEMQVDYLTSGPRALLFAVNGGPFITLNVGGGSFNLPASTTVPVALHAGLNTIQFGNPTSYPPDLDRIVVSGDGFAPAPTSTTYEAENAALGGSASAVYCELCSGASKAGNIGGGSGTVTFGNIAVPETGTYQMEIDYMTSGPRSFSVSINGGTAVELPLNGSAFDAPASTLIPVQLHAGNNTIEFDNPAGYAPDLDRIAIACDVCR